MVLEKNHIQITEKLHYRVIFRFKHKDYLQLFSGFRINFEKRAQFSFQAPLSLDSITNANEMAVDVEIDGVQILEKNIEAAIRIENIVLFKQYNIQPDQTFEMQYVTKIHNIHFSKMSNFAYISKLESSLTVVPKYFKEIYKSELAELDYVIKKKVVDGEEI